MRFKNDAELWRAAAAEKIKRILRFRAAKRNPAFLSYFVKCVDSRTGEIFEFTMLSEEECESIRVPYKGNRWFWQREYLEWCVEHGQTITLKGRQLGVTWVWSLLALWYALFRPGSDVLVYSIKEEDAVQVVNRIWDMWLSLPDYLKRHIKVLRPARGRPSTIIEFEHTDGRVSSVTGMVATKHAGHGRSAALIIFDEAARQEYARELWKAVIPASGDRGGKIGVVSTANGMSDGHGGGNFFHELWVGAGGVSFPTLKKKFLPWHLHPERDDFWYRNVPLPDDAKAEQYPNDEDEAFLLTGSPFFDTRALQHYSRDARVDPLYQAEFAVSPNNGAIARLSKGEGLPLEVYREPKPGRKYAIGCDEATGRGTDFSVAAVIDLHDGAQCAELRMKADYRDFTRQVHFLGLWYNTALIAPEKGGGYGDVVIAYLRDGHEGRRPYPRIYRHRAYDDPTREFKDQLGFPMNEKTRAKITSELQEWVNKRLYPWVTRRFLSESKTFVRKDTRPSPRADDGANDDSVMAWGIATEMYSQFGEHEQDIRKRPQRKLSQEDKEVLRAKHRIKSRMADPLDPRRRR